MEKDIRICPQCKAPLKPESLFCKICGAPVEVEKKQPAEELPKIGEVTKPAEVIKLEEVEEPEEPITGVFAEGLPQWSLEPPQVMVRRKRSI